MKNITKRLLQQYFIGKDYDLPNVIESIFTKHAVVTFDIKTSVIDFPKRMEGSKLISEQMFSTFHENFHEVESYYLINDENELDKEKIENLNWLVLMRERNTGLIRVGTGYYDWKFQKNSNGVSDLDWLVSDLHIHINEMIVFQEPSYNWLRKKQLELNSSWVPYEQSISSLSHIEELEPVLQYLTSKKLPN